MGYEYHLLQEGDVHMSENIFNTWMILLAIVIISVAFLLYMSNRVVYEGNVFHKLWFLIRYVYLKFEIGVGYGIEAVKNVFVNKEKEKTSGYAIETPRMTAIRGKEKKIREMQERHLRRGKGKKDYNMKILD
ncbi:MAG: hypothetical protein PHQ72_12355 [Hespellia sp.]|nr:hypothetical protein [Hespellia sp.]